MGRSWRCQHCQEEEGEQEREVQAVGMVVESRCACQGKGARHHGYVSIKCPTEATHN